MEARFDGLSEQLDKIASQWWAFPTFLLTVILVWVVVGYDYANLWISIVTVGFFFLFNYGQRKDRLANQLKHDVEIDASDAPNEIKGVEKLTLSELEARNGN